MKKLLLLFPLFILLHLHCFSKTDTLFYSAEHTILKNKKEAAYGRIITYNEDSTKMTIEDFYINGIKMSKRTIKILGSNKIEAVAHYYKDGGPKSFYTVLNEKLDGNCLSYGENGKLVMISIYEN